METNFDVVGRHVIDIVIDSQAVAHPRPVEKEIVITKIVGEEEGEHSLTLLQLRYLLDA